MISNENPEWYSEATEEELKWLETHSNEIVSRPVTELKEIASEILTGNIFTSAQVPKDQENMMSQIFLPPFFMEFPSERARHWYLKNWGTVFGKMEDALPKGVNGFPMFMKTQTLNKSDSAALYELVQKMHAAMKSV